MPAFLSVSVRVSPIRVWEGVSQGSADKRGLLQLLLLLSAYTWHRSLDYTAQIYLAIKQKGTKGPSKAKLIPDLGTENAITIKQKSTYCPCTK